MFIYTHWYGSYFNISFTFDTKLGFLELFRGGNCLCWGTPGVFPSYCRFICQGLLLEFKAVDIVIWTIDPGHYSGTLTVLVALQCCSHWYLGRETMVLRIAWGSAVCQESTLIPYFLYSPLRIMNRVAITIYVRFFMNTKFSSL